MIPVYRNIKTVAKERGIPLYIVERKAGLSNGSMCKWDSVSPTVNNLKKVADVLCVYVDLLLKM